MQRPTDTTHMTTLFGVDPGFRFVGCAKLILTPTGEYLHSMFVVKTEKSQKKRNVKEVDDNTRRTREIARSLLPYVTEADVVCIEAMSHPRHMPTAAKLSLCHGAIIALCEVYGRPLLQATPQEIKKCILGKGSGSKESIQLALRQRFGRRAYTATENLNVGSQEHAYDALAAILTCLDTDTVRLARALREKGS